MSQLNIITPRGQQGSTLVLSLVLVSVMMISTAGLMQVAVNTVRGGENYIDDQRVQLAAESGILMAARWLRGSAAVFPLNGTILPFSGPLLINGVTVYDTLTAATSGGITTVSISATAFYDPSGSAESTPATYRKTIRLNSVRRATFGTYGTFFDGASSSWGGFTNRIFEGRFHMNRSLMIHSSGHPSGSTPVIFRDGLVTTGTMTNHNGGYGDGAHDANNYDYGVNLTWGGGSAAQCDQIFQSKFLANQDNIALPTGLSATAFSSHPGKKTLPTSAVDQGEAYNHYRPTLELKMKGSVPWYVYHYRTSTSTKKADSGVVNTGTVFIAQNNLNVLGTTTGQVTIATTAGKSICPVGNLVYSDYSTATGTVAEGSQSIIGLVSGKNFRYNHQWKRDLTGSSASQATISGTMHLNGSFIAVEGSSATEYWDETYAQNYDLKLTGNHILKMWDPPSSGSKGAQGTLTFTHDLRLATGLQPPGFPNVVSTDGLWSLSLSGYEEFYGM